MTDTSGPTSRTPFAFYDPDASCWRTSQGTFPWDSMSSSVTWPRRGSMRSGACFEPPTWEPPTNEHGSSSLLQTPTVEDASREGSQEWADRWKAGEIIPETQQRLRTQVRMLLPTPVVNDMGEGKTPERWDEWTAEMQAKHANGNGHGKSLAIEAQRLLPTPRTSDTNGAGLHGDGGMDLRTAVRTLPTPTAQDSVGSRNSTARRKPTSKKVHLGDTLTDAVWKTHGAPSWAKTNLPPTGALTPPPSTDGSEPSDDPPPDPPTTPAV